MTRPTLLALLSALIACKKSPPPAPAAAVDARTVEGGEVDEADVRAGKRTGLESAEATPEVATEDLVRGLLRGTVPWSKLVDPALGVVELAGGTVEHRCGAALTDATTAFATGATGVLDDPGLLYDVACDNTGLAVAIPGVTSHAVCSIASPSGDGMEYDLVFIPDPKLGLRLIGMSSTDALATDDALRDRFDEALGRYGARCP